MHNYITKYSQQQPPATVKQMAPVPMQMNPIEIKRAYEQMQQMAVPPVSQQDGINITITIEPNGGTEAYNYVDADTQNAQRFAASPLGQALSQPMEVAPDPEARKYIQRRSADILSRVLMNSRMPDDLG